MKAYWQTHKKEANQRRKEFYQQVVENIKSIRDGNIDDLNEQQLLSIQSILKAIHNGKNQNHHNFHGINLGDKNNDDIYEPENLEAFKDFLKSQTKSDTVSQISQIDVRELENMPFDFNVFGDEEKSDDSYFNIDSIPNENHQQDNKDQPTNTQKEQTIDKYGFVTYGHKPNMTNDEELFALNHAHDFNEPSI